MAIKDGLVLLFMLLFFGLLYAALSFSPRPATVAGGALVLKLDGAIVEQPQPQNPLDLVAGSNSVLREFRLRDVVHAIETAADDQKEIGEHTSELQSLMRISYAVFCLKKKKKLQNIPRPL